MAKFGIGQPVRRTEDKRFITGSGRYTDDIDVEGAAYLAVVRSPQAHARIAGIDAEAAKAAPGVLLVMTAADLDAMGDNAIPCQIPMTNRDGSTTPQPKHPILTGDRVRYVGDKVAFVVAETRAQARDAAELVEVGYEELPAVADTAAATSGPVLFDEVPRNLGFDWQYGDAAKADAAFAQAAHVTKLDLVNNRIVCNAMEPRAAVAVYDAAEDSITLWSGTQGPWSFRDNVAANLGLPPEKVRVVTPDVGGGFGMKGFFYPEYTMCAAAARQLKRPVRWTGERGESFLSDSQGRDHVTTAELAFDADNRITAMRVKTIANMGAYYFSYAPYIPTGAALKVLPGVYDIPVLSYEVEGVLTNTVPVDAYRGAGRPESIYCIERIIEKAAHELGVDTAELRRINFVKPEQMPYTSSAGETYDSGEFERVMDACLAKAGWKGVDGRKAEARRAGKYRGIGMCYYIESTMGDPTEHATVRFEEDGTVSVLVGTQSNGQGHETAYAQVLHHRLNVPFDKIRIVQGDTAQIKTGGGTGGSRSLTAQGMAIMDASDSVIEKGKAFAAQIFEAAQADIQFDEGSFRVAGTDRAVEIMDLARQARSIKLEGMENGLDTSATTELPAWTFPNGCHIAEVDVDAETGTVDLVRYSVVDDFGVVLNPMLVEGQVHGGIVQGIGQALYENTVYDEGGQLLSGSFMDYCMPRADNLVQFDFSTVEVPCKNNAMGVKGCGEAGTVGSPASVINAIIDALGGLGVTAVDMPATPEKLWQLIHGEAQRRAA